MLSIVHTTTTGCNTSVILTGRSQLIMHRTIGLMDYYRTISDGLSGYLTRVRVRGPIVPVSPMHY